MKKCVFAWTSFPPIKGHEYIIIICSSLFDEVVVAVVENTSKAPAIGAKDRVRLLEKMCSNFSNIRVICHTGTAGDLLKEENTPYYVRGIRDALDVAYETRDFYETKKITPEVIEIYIPAEQELMHISSTYIRNCVKFHKDFKEFVPESIYEDIKALMEA